MQSVLQKVAEKFSIDNDTLYASFVEAMKEVIINVTPNTPILQKKETSETTPPIVKESLLKETNTAQPEALKAPKKQKVPCSWEKCDKSVALVERKIEGKCYCSKHYERMCNKVKAAEKANEKVLHKQENTICNSVTEKKGNKTSKETVNFKPVSFDFRNENPIDFLEEKNEAFWSLLSFSLTNQERLVISEKTNLIFHTCPIKQQQEGMLFGLYKAGQVIPTCELDISILNWVKDSNITFMLPKDE
jgi:hypothetical protein